MASLTTRLAALERQRTALAGAPAAAGPYRKDPARFDRAGFAAVFTELLASHGDPSAPCAGPLPTDARGRQQDD